MNLMHDFKKQDVFDYGKLKGMRIDEVDDDYLKTFSVSHLWSKRAKVDVHNLLSDLKICSRKKDIHEGRRLHKNAVQFGSDSNIFVAAALINMYAKCGSMSEAHTVFDSIHDPDVVSWTALILGYAGNGKGHVALDVFFRMKSVGECAPNSVTYVAAIKACTSLAESGDVTGKEDYLKCGREIHSEIGNQLNRFVQNTLIKMYAKCGSMAESRLVFDSIELPDMRSWTALIVGYAENGEGQAALNFFSRLKTASAYALDSVTYVAAIKACTSLTENGDEAGKGECLKRGREIHSEIGQHMDHFILCTLISMYAKCGSMVESQKVFDSIDVPDAVSWNALILGYAENGEGQAALDSLARMKAARGCAPNSGTLIAAIKACTSLGDAAECLKRGKELHSENCHQTDFSVQSALINMYAKLGCMVDAHQVFDGIEDPNVVSWNALIMGYADNRDGHAALDFFLKMKISFGCAPNSVTYVAAIKACTSLAADADEAGKLECLRRGREIHSEIGQHINHFVWNTLINMYAKLGSMLDALRVFGSIEKPNVVSWNALILGYVDNGEGQVALEVFSRMKSASTSVPNSVTYIAAVKACISLTTNGDEAGKVECLKRGREIHLEIPHQMNDTVRSTLVNMYAKCGSMEDAQSVFDSIEDPNVVSWTVLIMGYADNGKSKIALDFFSRMTTAGGCAPNSLTYVAVLKACGSIGALTIGRTFHLEITDFNCHVVTCLVDFYAKCGSMVEAREVFDSHPKARDITTWNALLAGYGSSGDIGSVFSLFEVMQDQGFRPDVVTFVCMLSCCSHAGLVEKAREYLEVMPVQYGVTPTVMHYSCMIDVLSRANQLDEAVAVLQNMPCNPDAVTLMTFLGVCLKRKNVEIGRLVFQSLVEFDEKNAAAYVLMAQIYGSRGMWEEQQRLLESRKSALKLPRIKSCVGAEEE